MTGIKDYVNIWVSDGREIENYVPDRLWEEFLNSEDAPHKKRFKNQEGELFSSATDSSLGFMKYQRFNEYLMTFSKLNINGTTVELDEDQKKCVAEHYANVKVKIAAYLWEPLKTTNLFVELGSKMLIYPSKLRFLIFRSPQSSEFLEVPLCEKWTAEDMNNPDLMTQSREIIRRIRLANGLA
jgi:hypothetical protein